MTIYKLFIFDLDQTLIDTLHRFHTALNLTLLEFGGRPVGWGEFRRLYMRDELNTLIPEGVDTYSFWKKFRGKMSGWIHVYDRPIYGSKEVLEWVKSRGGRVVVTTGRDSHPEHVWLELKIFGLSRYVDKIYTIRLQDPRDEDQLFSRRGLLKHAMEEYNAGRFETIFVGDYWVDMRSAKTLGITSIGVLTGLESREKLVENGADYVIEDVSYLPRLILEIERRSSF